MNHLHRAAIAIVAALAFLFAGTAVAQDQSDDPMLPYYTREECEANGGVWTWDFCVDPEKVPAENLYSGWDPDETAPAAPATAQPAPSTPGQPQFTG